jgi:hypothetical protein
MFLPCLHTTLRLLATLVPPLLGSFIYKSHFQTQILKQWTFFFISVSSIDIEIKILLIDKILDNFMCHSVRQEDVNLNTFGVSERLFIINCLN